VCEFWENHTIPGSKVKELAAMLKTIHAQSHGIRADISVAQ
jgi:hypothetical protein